MEDVSNNHPDLRYKYELTLSMAKPGNPFTEEDCKALEQAIADYNERSIYMANPKQIHLLEVTDSCINLQLFSQNALGTPGRGLRTLTTILLNDPMSRFADRVTPGGQLFRVINVKQPTCESTLINPALISDADFVKAILDYIIDGSTCPKKEAALEEMKKLAVEAGIISSTSS